MRIPRALLGLAALAAVIHVLGPSFSGANFTAGTKSNTGAMAAGRLGAPTAFHGAPVGRDVRLDWTAGTDAASTSIAMATSANPICAGATWAPLATTAATTLLDAGRHAPQGTYACYAATAVRSSWTSTSGNPAVAVQIGVVASSVLLTNAADRSGCGILGGAAGRLDCGDTIAITFNQPMATATGPAATGRICIGLDGSLALGQNGLCTGTPIATLSGTGLSLSTSTTAAATWSGDGRVLTFRATGTPLLDISLSGGGALQLRPTTDAAKLQSSTGGHHVCDTQTGGGNCFPTPTGSL